jgi:hypothetical protein
MLFLRRCFSVHVPPLRLVFVTSAQRQNRQTRPTVDSPIKKASGARGHSFVHPSAPVFARCAALVQPWKRVIRTAQNVAPEPFRLIFALELLQLNLILLFLYRRRQGAILHLPLQQSLLLALV